MRRITIIRLIVTALVMPFVVVLYLNIERYAEEHGYDVILIKLLEPKEADVISPIISFAFHPATLYGAIGFVTFVVGIWFDALLRRGESTRLSKHEKLVVLGEKCQKLVTLIDQHPADIKGGERIILNRIWAEWLPIEIELEKVGLKTPDRTITSGDDVIVVQDYAQFIGNLLLDGNLKWAKKTATGLSGAPSPTNAIPLHQWLSDIAQKMWLKIRPG